MTRLSFEKVDQFCDMSDVDADWDYLGGSFTLRLGSSLSRALLGAVHGVLKQPSAAVANGSCDPTPEQVASLVRSFVLSRSNFHALATMEVLFR